MTVVLPETVSTEIFLTGFFEEEATRMFLTYLKPGMTLFDIGAHYGYYTLLGRRIVGDSGKVYSFEPSPDTFTILLSNIKDIQNIHANNLAVFSKTGTIHFKDYGFLNSGNSTLYEARLPENIRKTLNPRKLDAQAVALDEFIHDNNIKPDFIKIDAEGSEYEILQGMQKTLIEDRPIISVEVGDYDIEGVVSSKTLILYLINKGYQPYEFISGRITEHQLRDKYDQGELFFLPKNKY